MVAGVWALALGVGVVQAEQGTTAQPPAVDPAKQAAMEAIQRLGSPSEGHQALEPLLGTWSYTAQWWMSPDEPPQSMTGTSVNTLIFGGRFLKQEVGGQPMEEGQPPFEGVGFTGYDNLRKEYQSVWFDNMMTGMMVGAGQFDAATNTLTDEGNFSCPITGETHRWYRTAWTVVDKDHTTYESYSRTPEGREFKSMEIRYSRVQWTVRMNRRPIPQRLRTALLGACAAAFALAVAVPHQHGPSSVSHPAHQCRACKIQEGFSAAQPTVFATLVQQGWVAINPLPPGDAPRLLVAARLPSPRAPPARS